MPFGGKGEKYTNAEGWRRDLKYFWRELLDRHPEAFSPNNRREESALLMIRCLGNNSLNMTLKVLGEIN
ncbi:hypothetical protein [Bacillus sp. C1]